jgi:glycosyltransferase involved in cell wall biosynthesis
VSLPPFLDTLPFREAARDRGALARRHDLDEGEPWLLAAAMMRADQKLLSYRCLADALSRLADLPWRLLVAGNGPAEAEVRAAFAPVAARVRWLGALDGAALRGLYAACDLCVWPAVKEAWGMVLVEAQAAGLAVVAGRSGGVASVVADGETGLLVTPGDAGAFAGAVRRLLADPDLRRMMGSAAMARAACEHDIGAAADRLDRHLAALARPR